MPLPWWWPWPSRSSSASQSSNQSPSSSIGHVFFVAAFEVAQAHLAVGQVVEADEQGELGAAAPGLLELGLGAAPGEVALGVDQQVAAQVLGEGEGVGAARPAQTTTT